MNEIGREIPDSALSRSQFVYGRLKEYIRNRTLVPGQRLREAEIAEMLNVSRTPVREAMNRLISEGLLALNPTRGFAVAELDKQQVLELYALRESLEGASARLAAQHASEPELTSLADLLAENRAIDSADYARHAVLNKHFHARIAEAGHNRYLQRALANLSDSLMLVPGTTYELPGRVLEVHREHNAILDAMQDRDPDRAEAAAREHIRNAGAVRLKLLFGRY
jgi:DNA-binding GntR family transcriptional regulator